MSEESQESTVTKFSGDIVFNNGENDVKASDLAIKSELPVVDKLGDIFDSMDTAPDSAEQLTLKDIAFDDSHVMSSLATKMLIDKSTTNIDLTDYATKSELTTTLTDYATTESVKNVLTTNDVVNENKCILLPIVFNYTHSTKKLNIETSNKPKRLKIVSDEPYGGIYVYNNTDYGGVSYYQNEDESLRNTYEVRYNASAFEDNKGVSVYMKSSGYIYLNTNVFMQFDGSNEWEQVILYEIPYYKLSYDNAELRPYVKFSETIHIKSPEKYKGVYHQQNWATGYLTFTNEADDNIQCYVYNENRTVDKVIEIYDKSKNEYTPLSNDLSEIEVYGEKEISKVSDNDKAQLIPSLKYVDSLHANSNTTITHYCPIEADMNSITDFIIGSPVYLTGKVYKFDKLNKSFLPSTVNDSIDCICSVKTNGNWNEFVGICVAIDEVNKCITFATGGDYLVRVNDTLCYKVGDEVFVDGEELKIITGQTAITAKIRRTTVGIVTGIIDKNMLAVIKF